MKKKLLMVQSIIKDMYKIELISNNEEETGRIGRAVASVLRKGSFVALYGDLAAGKTALSRYLFEQRGFTQGFSSPTFTVMNEYKNSLGQKAFHLDAYRLSSPEELDYIGWDQVDEGEFCVIEWANIIEEALPPEVIRIKLEYTPVTGQRAIEIYLPEEDDYLRLKELLK